jgi:hypothetical protein
VFRCSRQRFRIDRLSPPDRASQVGVVLGGGKANRRGRDGRNQDRHGAACDLPQGGGSLFLDFRVRREILEGKYVSRGQRDNGPRLGRIQEFSETLHDGQQFLGCPIVADHEDQWAPNCSLGKNQQQSLGGGG